MSLRAMLWALHDAPCTDPIDKLILITLADYAHDDGTSAWPSVATIAGCVHRSPMTVHRHLRGLETAGLIVRGDQEIVAHLRGDRRPVVYNLPLARGNKVIHGALSRGNTTTANGVTHGVSPVLEEPKNQVLNRRQRAALESGEPVGCADHGSRRPACDPCGRHGIGVEHIKPATGEATAAYAGAARASLKGSREAS